MDNFEDYIEQVKDTVLPDEDSIEMKRGRTCGAIIIDDPYQEVNEEQRGKLMWWYENFFRTDEEPQ